MRTSASFPLAVVSPSASATTLVQQNAGRKSIQIRPRRKSVCRRVVPAGGGIAAALVTYWFGRLRSW